MYLDDDFFPMYWYFYIYFHKINQNKFCNADHDRIKCIENIFITVIIIMYFIYLLIFFNIIIKFIKYEFWFGYFIEIQHDYNTRSVVEIVEDHNIFLGDLKRNEMIFSVIEYENIAMIICNYLPPHKT